ncbi:Rhodanese-like domain-containing protein [Xylaria arbuscula]|nr:Rhodanese-like domain-containing protein [Xylaria arbuscula]
MAWRRNGAPPLTCAERSRRSRAKARSKKIAQVREEVSQSNGQMKIVENKLAEFTSGPSLPPSNSNNRPTHHYPTRQRLHPPPPPTDSSYSDLAIQFSPAHINTSVRPPIIEPASLTREEVLGKLRTGSTGRDFIIVDVRRNDYEGGTVRGAINLPAQSLYPTIPTLYQLFKNASIEYIIFCCGSSKDHGPRAASCFNDHIQEQGDKNMKSVTLTGGIKGWANAGEEFVKFMDGYVPEYWAQFQ